MAHFAKYSKGAVGHLSKHYERAKDEKGEYIKFGNESIDTSKSHLNYNLAPNHGMSQGEFIKNRCNEVHCLNRKDVNVLCSWVVTAPKDLEPIREREFFEQSYKFLKERYGKENVVSAYVHMDEVTPHIHYSFVPVLYDKKKEKYKVSAKERVNRTDLKTFHKDLSKHMERHFGKDIGIINEATKEGNKSIEELKRQSATERIDLVKANSKRIMSTTHLKASEMLQKATQHVEKVYGDIKPLENKKKALEERINALEGTLNTFSDIDHIGKKGVFGKINITPDELKQLKDQAKAYFSEKSKRIDLEHRLRRSDEVANQVKPMYKEIIELRKELKQSNGKSTAMEKVIKSSPDLVKAFNKQAGILREEHQQKQAQAPMKRSRSFDMER